MSADITRRQLLSVGAGVAAATVAGRFFVLESFAQTGNAYQPLYSQLDRFVEQYMRNMNAPGMTLVLADRDGVQRIATYGFSDVERKSAVQPDQLFHIGSISKSFVAISLLQLHEEGKLDLNKPVTEYMPWFRIDSQFAPITTHHLLTHSSGLPSIPPVFPSDPAQKHRAAYAPGDTFHYCNMGYSALGHLLWTLDGRPLPEILRKRMFEPLGMDQSEPVITLDIRDRVAKNYDVYQNDRPYPRYGKICEAPSIVITDGDGCIASTPRDMGRYIQMFTLRGKSQRGQLISAESFEMFAKPYLKAPEFGPTASYGYGMGIDTLDGHKILRHTGGMVSFASALQVDVDEGVGAFASINAMQGYRPNPVAQYALQLMRAQRASKSLPAMPPLDAPTKVEKAEDYAGTYRSADGRSLEFIAEADKLFLMHQGKRVTVESGGDSFTILHPDFERFPLVFSRKDEKDPKSPVVEAGWGNDWYTDEKYSGPKTFDYPKEWNSYLGHYRNENPWIGSTHIVIRKGKLMMDGVVPLEAADGGVFYLRDEEKSPEWIRFGEIVNGKAIRLKLSGEDLWRVMAA